MNVEFTAILQGASCIKFDSDKSGTIKLIFDASQFHQIADLVPCMEKPLLVTIRVEEEPVAWEVPVEHAD